MMYSLHHTASAEGILPSDPGDPAEQYKQYDCGDYEYHEMCIRDRCGDILEKLPDGIDTQIGTEGTYLSGGCLLYTSRCV